MTTASMLLGAANVVLAMLAGSPTPRAPLSAAHGDTVVIRPGGGFIDGRRVHPYTTHWRVTYQMPDGRMVAGGPRRTVSWYDTVTVSTDEGKRVLHRRQTLYAPDSVLLEVLDNWADARTMVPFRSQLSLTNKPLTTRVYGGRRITGLDPDSTAPNGTRQVDVTVSEPVFDFYGGLYDVFLAALPLRPGLVVKLPTDDPTAREGAGLMWTSLTVIGREAIATDTPRGRVDTWRVEAPAAGGVAGVHFVFWIADEAPYLVRMWYVGPRGGRQVWDITQ